MKTKLTILALGLLLGVGAAIAQTNLPLPPPPFEGTIGKTYKESKPAWPKILTAAKDAPNVIIILLDDVGFGQTSTFGGLIPTSTSWRPKACAITGSTRPRSADCHERRCSPGGTITTPAMVILWSGLPGSPATRP